MEIGWCSGVSKSPTKERFNDRFLLYENLDLVDKRYRILINQIKKVQELKM